MSHPTTTDLDLAAAMAEVTYTHLYQYPTAVECCVEAAEPADYGSHLDQAHELATELHSAGWEVLVNRGACDGRHDEVVFAARLDDQEVADGREDEQCALYLSEGRDAPPADDPQRMTVANWPEPDPARDAGVV